MKNTGVLLLALGLVFLSLGASANLLLNLSMDTNGTNLALDTSGGGRDYTSSTVGGFVSGYKGNCYQTDASHILSPSFSSTPFSNFTLCLWANETGRAGSLRSLWGNGVTGYPEVSSSGSDLLYYGEALDSYTSPIDVSSAVYNTYQYYCVVVNASDNTTSFYLNGTLVDSLPMQESPQRDLTSDNIGGWSLGERWWVGCIDEVLFYDDAKPSKDIFSLYSSYTGETTTTTTTTSTTTTTIIYPNVETWNFNVSSATKGAIVRAFVSLVAGTYPIDSTLFELNWVANYSGVTNQTAAYYDIDTSGLPVGAINLTRVYVNDTNGNQNDTGTSWISFTLLDTTTSSTSTSSTTVATTTSTSTTSTTSTTVAPTTTTTLVPGTTLAGSGYVPVYQTSDLGVAILDLVVSVVVGVAGQGNIIGQAVVVLFIVSLIGGVGTALLVSAYGLFKGGKQ